MLEVATPNEADPDPLNLKDTAQTLSLIGESPIRSEFNDEDHELVEVPLEQHKTLEDHLLTQLRLEINDPLQLKIGELIIGNLDADGYLSAQIDEIAWLAKTEDIELIEKVLFVIQQFEPVGIASRDIKECLINQIHSSKTKHREAAMKILKEHFEHFFQKKFDLISKATSITIETISEIALFIGTLEPKPARNFQGGEPTVYVRPDAYVFKDDEGNFQVQINKNETPSIRINPVYMKLLKEPSTSQKDRKFIQEKLANAINFIKSIQQRGETLRQICKLIVQHQKSFFEGKTVMLTPLALKDIAQILKRNESTISRAVHNKYMQTSLGMFPLRFFFSNAVNEYNTAVSSHNIKLEIKNLVNAEDKANPLTDQEIQEHFQSRGMKMARRTINKYRQNLNIPPSNQRKG